MSPDKLGFTLREFLRYGYAGLLLVLVAALLVPDITSKVMQTLGNVLSPLVVFALGAVIYSLHRALVNDYIIEPLVYWIHRPLEYFWGYRRILGGHNSARHYLEKTFGVSHRHSINALRIVRDDNIFANDKARDRIHVQNSEITLLFVTATIMGAAALLLKFIDFKISYDRNVMISLFGGIAIVFFLVGISAGISVSRQLCAHICAIPADDVRRLLRAAQLTSE
jgi:hypothetical protein